MIIKKLQEELDKNEEYKDLLLERKEILRSNGFINKLQPRFEAICERLQEIDNETQKKLWGEVVLKDSDEYSGLGVRAVRWLGNRLAII